jgi:hypothetical protein
VNYLIQEPDFWKKNLSNDKTIAPLPCDHNIEILKIVLFMLLSLLWNARLYAIEILCVCGGKGTLLYCWWECKLVQPLWKKIWRLPKNLNIDLPYDPAIPLLGIYPRECDTGYSRGTCTPVVIAALFTIAKLWK